MSKSYRNIPIGGATTARSDKKCKRAANRSFRRRTREAIRARQEPPASLQEVSNVWKFSKDGKRWFGWREGVEWWERFMRK